jgi:hypothetical protein
VEHQIEKLKIMEMEKQLELKEAATKRKIQALKQQLSSANQESRMGEGNPRRDSVQERGQERNYYPRKNTGDNHMIAQGPSALEPSFAPKFRSKATQATVISPFSDVAHPTSTPLTDHVTLSPFVATTFSHVTPPVSADVTPLVTTAPPSSITSHTNTPFSADHMTPPTTFSSSHTTHPSHVITSPSTSVTVSAYISSTNPQTLSSNEVTLPNDRNHVITADGHKMSSPTTSTPQANHTAPHRGDIATTPTCKEKLTIPEEVKETEYMSAVQKQKVRVSRIRRCIVAATVIQRAWRARACRIKGELP